EAAAHIPGLGVLRLGLDGFCRQLDRVLPLAFAKRDPGLSQQFLRAWVGDGSCKSDPQPEQTERQTSDRGTKDSHGQCLARSPRGRKGFGSTESKSRMTNSK